MRLNLINPRFFCFLSWCVSFSCQRSVFALKRTTAFSLVELILVMIIMSILAIAVVPRLGGLNQRAGIEATRAEMVEIQKAIMGDGRDYRGYFTDTGLLPPDNTLTVLTAAQAITYNPFLQTGGSRGNYLAQADANANGTADVLEDAWGTAYQFTQATGVITSLGPNRAAGGGDDITVDVNG